MRTNGLNTSWIQRSWIVGNKILLALLGGGGGSSERGKHLAVLGDQLRQAHKCNVVGADGVAGHGRAAQRSARAIWIMTYFSPIALFPYLIAAAVQVRRQPAEAVRTH